MLADEQERLYEQLKRKGYVIDVRDRANVVVMHGKASVGIFSSYEDALVHALADYDWRLREYDSDPL